MVSISPAFYLFSLFIPATLVVTLKPFLHTDPVRVHTVRHPPCKPESCCVSPSVACGANRHGLRAGNRRRLWRAFLPVQSQPIWEMLPLLPSCDWEPVGAPLAAYLFVAYWLFCTSVAAYQVWTHCLLPSVFFFFLFLNAAVLLLHQHVAIIIHWQLL